MLPTSPFRGIAEQLEIDELKISLPAIRAAEINEILKETKKRAGDEVTPEVWLDAEHLQVLDYRSLAGVTDHHRAVMDKWHAISPIIPEDLAFLALRSMFCFSWPNPTCREDAERALRYEAALHATLLRWSRRLSGRLLGDRALLPNWGRLSFLRVLGQLPDSACQQIGLKSLACTLTKQAHFNAYARRTADYSLIGYNYVLEPILKMMNRFILGYHNTQHLAGNQRVKVAWAHLAPLVMYFHTKSSASTMHLPMVLLDHDIPRRAHDLTAKQLDHITTHEFGHVALNHEKQWADLDANDPTIDWSLKSKQMEFEADEFAANRIKATRPLLGGNNPISLADHADFAESVTAVELLCAHQWFIENAGLILRHRLVGNIEFTPLHDTHPSPSDRMQRIRATLGPTPSTDDLSLYTVKFYFDLIEYIHDLAEDELIESVGIKA